MKYISTLLLALVCTVATAQPCGNSGTNICTPTLDWLSDDEGFHPANSNDIPCLTRGTAYANTIQLVFPTAVTPQGLSSTYGVNSWRIDSIENLPCGICWATNDANNFFFPQGDVACIKFSGTTNDVPGVYKLRIKFRINLSAGFTVSNQDAGHFEWEVALRVTDPGSFCPVVNASTQRTTSTAGIITTPVISPAGPVTLCQGGSTTLTAPAGYAAYLWSNGATTASINVTQSGNYTVKVFGGCDDETSTPVTVTVVQGNALTINPSGPLTFCQGGSVVLSATGTDYVNHTWSNNAQGTTITATQSGSFSVTALDTAHNCTTTSAAQIVTVLPPNFNVNVTPSVSGSLCAGDTLGLSVPTGYSSYLWSNGDNTLSTEVTEAGTYTVTVIYPNGNCQGMGQYIVNAGAVSTGTIDALQPDLSTNRACPGDTLFMAYFGGDIGNLSFQWLKNGEIIPGATSNVGPATGSGSYSLITTKVSTGCTRTTNAVTIQFRQLPAQPMFTPGFNTTICNNAAPVTLSGGSPAGGYYTIDNNTGAVTQLTPANLSVGAHTVVYYVSDQYCKNGDTVAIEVSNCTGISNILNGVALNIMPNPFADYISIKHPDLNKYDLVLTDVAGRIYSTQQAQISTATIATNGLASGMYLLKLVEHTTGKTVHTAKVIKQ